MLLFLHTKKPRNLGNESLLMSFEIIDLHCDTIMECYFGNENLKDRAGHINIAKLQKGGCMAQTTALYLPTDGKFGKDGKTLPWDIYKGMLACWKEQLALNVDAIRPAFSAQDIKQNADAGFMSAVLSVEDGIGIDGKIERVQEMYDDGVRMLALTWNWENCIGYPNSIDPKQHAKGLKPFGFDVVQQMNVLGMIVDVSHLSEGGFWDVERCSSRPFIASHSCARTLRDHQRNLTDEQLRALADKGGVVGVNFCSAFLSEDLRNTYAADIMRHMVHFADVAGIDAVAWGSDFDGIESNLDFDGYAGMPKLVGMLEKHFTDDEIDKINHDNVLRVFEDCL